MDRSSSRRYRRGAAELHLRGVVALFLMLAVAALVAAVHPHLVALGPLAFVPLLGAGRTGAYLTVPTYTLLGDTSARAQEIDDLDARAVPAGRVANSLTDYVVQIWNLLPRPKVSNVQRGTIVCTGGTTFTGTISTVDTTKATVRVLGFSVSGSTQTPDSYEADVTILNATTVQVKWVNGAGPGANTVVYAYEVVAWAGATGVQYGSVTIPGAATSATATLTSVNAGTSFVEWGGQDVGVTTPDSLGYLELTSATALTATRHYSGAGSTTFAYSVVSY